MKVSLSMSRENTSHVLICGAGETAMDGGLAGQKNLHTKGAGPELGKCCSMHLSPTISGLTPLTSGCLGSEKYFKTFQTVA